MNNIAIFASGSGSNAENIINHFSGSLDVNISLVLSDKKDAYVLQRAENHGIRSCVFTKDEFVNTDKVLDILVENDIDFIVLAGFLLLVPSNIVDRFSGRIINIHPALLPSYGGKGMYGMNVHKAIIEAQEKVSGITIHHVNSEFDSGDTIFQARVDITADDTAESLASKIHELEYRYFPSVIAEVVSKYNR